MNHFEEWPVLWRVTPKERPVRAVWSWPVVAEVDAGRFSEPGDVLDWPEPAVGENN